MESLKIVVRELLRHSLNWLSTWCVCGGGGGGRRGEWPAWEAQVQAIHLCLPPGWNEWVLGPLWAHLRASLWKENISWMKATSWEGVFCNWRPYHQLGELSFSYIWLLPTVLCLVSQRIYQKQFCSFQGPTTYQLRILLGKQQISFPDDLSGTAVLWSLVGPKEQTILSV